jgi:Ribbon-helix-helix protein, copG family
MNLAPHVETLRRELVIAAEAGGDEARSLAERLTTPLDSATRLVLLEALSDAASEITQELAPGSVEVRLRGREPEFVVTSPPAEQSFEDVGASSIETSTVFSGEIDESGASRTTLRLPDQVKARVDEAAAREGLSVNAWLVRAVVAALEPGARDRRRGPSVGQQYTGWVQ